MLNSYGGLNSYSAGAGLTLTVDISETGPLFSEAVVVAMPIKVIFNPRNTVIIKRKSNTLRVR